MKRTKKVPKEYAIPKFKIETIEDAYTFFVVISGVSEDTFWNAPISSLQTIYANKAAFDGWTSSVQYQLAQKRKRKMKRR